MTILDLSQEIHLWPLQLAPVTSEFSGINNLGVGDFFWRQFGWVMTSLRGFPTGLPGWLEIFHEEIPYSVCSVSRETHVKSLLLSSDFDNLCAYRLQ
jgi:hypothetical protein